MDSIFNKRTSTCLRCGAIFDIDLSDSEARSRSFPNASQVEAGQCPACGGDISQDETPKAQITVASDETLRSGLVLDLDADGNQILEQVGEHYELRVNQQTGQIYSELVPDFAPKMRPLTDQELADLKLQRDQNLDALSSVAVKEVEAGPEAA